MDETQRAAMTLQMVYDDLVKRLTDATMENEEGLRSSPYSFSLQELEDRFAPRLVNIGHLIFALYHASRQRQPPARYRVHRVEGELDELDTLINQVLRESPAEQLHNVALAQDEEAGTWHAFLTLCRPTQ
jgi:hypothetical protein